MKKNKKTEILSFTEYKKMQEMKKMQENGLNQRETANLPEEPDTPVLRRCLDWYMELDGSDRISFLCSLVIDPVFLILFAYGITGNWLFIPLAYLIVDPLIILCWIRNEKKRREEEVPFTKEYFDFLRQLLADVYGDEEENGKSSDKE